MLKIKERIDANEVQIQQISKKVNENKKLSEERHKLIGELESNLQMFRLEITEIQSVEYPEDVDVEVMVKYLILWKKKFEEQNWKYLILKWLQQSEVNDQTKVLQTLTKEFDEENAKMDQLNANVQEIKANMVKLKEQLQISETQIQEKQKAKDDIVENTSKRDSMVAYYQKNIKTLTEAMVKYEVNHTKKIRKKWKFEANRCICYLTARGGENSREVESFGSNCTESWCSHRADSHRRGIGQADQTQRNQTQVIYSTNFLLVQLPLLGE